jgi:hypothetical protein
MSCQAFPIGDPEVLSPALIEETERCIDDYKREREGG